MAAETRRALGSYRFVGISRHRSKSPPWARRCARQETAHEHEDHSPYPRRFGGSHARAGGAGVELRHTAAVIRYGSDPAGGATPRQPEQQVSIAHLEGGPGPLHEKLEDDPRPREFPQVLGRLQSGHAPMLVSRAIAAGQ